MDDLHEQKTLIMESAALGASIALNRLGLIKDEISQREAYRICLLYTSPSPRD